jgi:hypothetical protein
MFSQPRSFSAQASTLLQQRYVIVDHTLAKLIVHDWKSFSREKVALIFHPIELAGH